MVLHVIWEIFKWYLILGCAVYFFRWAWMKLNGYYTGDNGMFPFSLVFFIVALPLALLFWVGRVRKLFPIKQTKRAN